MKDQIQKAWEELQQMHDIWRRMDQDMTKILGDDNGRTRMGVGTGTDRKTGNGDSDERAE